ncbi:MAG: 30S ribosomal protein S15 [Coxiella sp. (in: Bacteria)]|nr:MAG: 30S ribosomal protein S15 [Coxiella sp. (in: g-proteobacteria)]
MSLTAAEKAEVVKEYETKPGDTGSSEVQIALLTHRINKLTGHFKAHIHDFHSRRGLLNLVSQRRKLLSYLRKQDLQTFLDLAKRLGLRVKA